MSKSENTYIINIDADPIALAETRRLDEQDQFLTARMKPTLPTSFHPHMRYEILDAACGTGGWMTQVAREFPRTCIAGIDVSERVLASAQDRAKTWGLDKQLRYQKGNILKRLELADNTFDLVHARLLQGVLDVESWPRFIKECYRVTKPGGYIKISESDVLSVANAPNFHKLIRYIYRSFWEAGKGFAETDAAIVPMLGKFMTEVGYVDVEEAAYPLNFSAGMPLHESIVKDFQSAHEMAGPFVVKHAGISEEEYLDVYQRVYTDPQCEMKTIRAVWYFASVVSRKPA